MHRGFIKLYRRINDWEWKKKPLTIALFVHLLLRASYKETSWQGIKIEAGQIVVGRKTLSKETGLSEQQIRTAIKHLKSTNEITIKSTNRFSIITVCNYSKYQPSVNGEQPSNQPADAPASNQQATTSKESKDLKEIKNLDRDFPTFDILELIIGEHMAQARENARGQDMNILIGQYNAWINEDISRWPKKPPEAFIGWVKSITKGKPPQ